ncbi:MAG: hypothetical protein LEGION0403_FIIPPAGN_01141 [Legionella sp.]|uniref:hypothetical protein n=1 Tax=Legionella sp. TaxID=459 RepID=UPI003D0DEF64
MPDMFEKRLSDCNAKLDTFFHGFILSEELIVASGLFIEGMNKTLSEYIDFEVSAPINDECKREVSVMSFFRPGFVEKQPSSNVESLLVIDSF